MNGRRLHNRLHDAGKLSAAALLTAGLLGSAAFAADPSKNAAPSSASAAEMPDGAGTAAAPYNKLNIPLGKSSLVNLKAPISRVAVGNPAVADVKMLNRKQVWVLGTGIGSTNLMLWDKAGNTLAAYDINVNLNVEQLNDEVRKLVQEGDVRVRSVRDKVVLEGRVPDPATAASVVEIVEAFGHKNIVNLLKVDTKPQAAPGRPEAAVEQIEIIRGTEITTKQFKAPQQ